MTLPRPFGHLHGREIPEITLRNDAGLEARIIAFGAVLRDLLVPGPDGPQRVVVGLRRMEDYAVRSRSFGAIVGRYANRVAGARFRLDGQDHRLVPNEGPNQLHGGPVGFGSRVWTLDGHDATRCRLSLVSEDGDMGYPGRVVATATYEIVGEATLRIALEAETDAPTPLNLTCHNYFNLDGSPDVREHRLTVAAPFMLPVDEAGIPTGEVRSVEGTPFDFRGGRAVRAPAGAPPYDHCLVLGRPRERPGTVSHAATLASGRNGLALQLWTSEPALQVYDGAKVDLPERGNGGLALRPFCGLALEPQRFPDGPNRPHFPPCILRPGEVSRQVTELRFAFGA